jgi:hypothetical protein
MRGEKIEKILLVFVLVFILCFHLVSAAGVGLKWDKESVIIPENEKTCLTYYVYNPWPTDSYVQMRLSSEMQSIVSSYQSEKKLVPAGTSSANALPLEFCFKIPSVYEKDCWIGDSLFCKEECTQDMKIYSGDVQAFEISEAEFNSGSAGGSKTQMSVSAPIQIGVQCIAHGRNLSLIYIIVALIAGTLLVINLVKRKRASKKKVGSSSIKSKKNK